MSDTQQLPVLPLKNSVLFPHLLMPLSVGRPGSRAAVEAALATEEKEIIVVAQRDPNKEVPGNISDLYGVGAKAVIKRMARVSDSQMDLIVLGLERVSVLALTQQEPFPRAEMRALPLPDEKTAEVEALHRAVTELAARALQMAQPNVPGEVSQVLAQAEDPLRLVYLLASMMSLELPKEQSLLEAETRGEALRLMHTYLTDEIQVLELRNKIASQAQS